MPTHRRRRHPSRAGAAGFPGGRASLSPCIPPHNQGLTISKLSVFVEHTHTHTYTHTHTQLFHFCSRAPSVAPESRRREKKNQKVGPSLPLSPQILEKGEGWCVLGDRRRTPRRHDATHTHTHTHTHTRYDYKACARERPPPFGTPRTFIKPSGRHRVCRGQAHIPQTHTARRLFCQKKQKAKRFGFFLTNPPNSCVVLTVSVAGR